MERHASRERVRMRRAKMQSFLAVRCGSALYVLKRTSHRHFILMRDIRIRRVYPICGSQRGAFLTDSLQKQTTVKTCPIRYAPFVRLLVSLTARLTTRRCSSGGVDGVLYIYIFLNLNIRPSS